MYLFRYEDSKSNLLQIHVYFLPIIIPPVGFKSMFSVGFKVVLTVFQFCMGAVAIKNLF